MRSCEVLPHTADLRLKVYGISKEDLFRNALKGMFESVHPKGVGTPAPPRTVKVQSTDINSLLVDFLSEALTLSDINDEAYLDAEISALTDTQIEAELRGIKIKGFEEEIKAVTHHEVDIKKVGDRWETMIVFDI